MTDNEITKALNEADGLHRVKIYCADRKGNHIASVRVIDIVDLINRLQAHQFAGVILPLRKLFMSLM